MLEAIGHPDGLETDQLQLVAWLEQMPRHQPRVPSTLSVSAQFAEQDKIAFNVPSIDRLSPIGRATSPAIAASTFGACNSQPTGICVLAYAPITA